MTSPRVPDPPDYGFRDIQSLILSIKDDLREDIAALSLKVDEALKLESRITAIETKITWGEAIAGALGVGTIGALVPHFLGWLRGKA